MTDENKFTAITDDGKTYFLNQAAVTFFKWKPWDELFILINEKDGGSFAAIEAVIKK
jgi:protein associated with RNAse G/E